MKHTPWWKTLRGPQEGQTPSIALIIICDSLTQCGVGPPLSISVLCLLFLEFNPWHEMKLPVDLNSKCGRDCWFESKTEESIKSKGFYTFSIEHSRIKETCNLTKSSTIKRDYQLTLNRWPISLCTRRIRFFSNSFPYV